MSSSVRVGDETATRGAGFSLDIWHVRGLDSSRRQIRRTTQSRCAKRSEWCSAASRPCKSAGELTSSGPTSALLDCHSVCWLAAGGVG
jgi:hypothetical protein